MCFSPKHQVELNSPSNSVVSPSGQEVQELESGSSLYVPIGQIVQLPESASLIKPLLHTVTEMVVVYGLKMSSHTTKN